MAAPRKIKSYYYQLADYSLGVTIALSILDIAVVGLRLLARKKQKLSLRMDDWLIFPALICTLGSASAVITGVAKDAWGVPVNPPPQLRGKNPKTVVFDQLIIAKKIEYVMNVLLVMAVGCIKMSFLFFYLRIFSSKNTSKSRYAIYTAMAICGLWLIGFFFAHAFVCGTKFSAYWGPHDVFVASCIDTLKRNYGFAVSDVITDALVLLLPIPLLWRLQLSTGRRVALSAVFLLGSAALASSAVRLAYSVQFITLGFDPRLDQLLVITGMLGWLQVEACLGILAACLPTITPLFKDFSPETVLRSVRSLLSLHSNDSQRQNSWPTSDLTGRPSQNSSRPSQVKGDRSG